MNKIKKTYRHIAAILCFKSDTKALERILSNTDFDWDSIVKIGSAHFMLPAIYCRLHSKNLLVYLPKSLIEHLKEITQLNRERNQAILEQLHAIRLLFDKHKVSYVFLKGSALLLAGFYKNIAERMIGDIDILIAPNQLRFANELLLKNGYSTTKTQFETHSFSVNRRHLPRIYSENAIAAVELHERLFDKYEIPSLISQNILNNKQELNSFNIPKSEHLLFHSILNWQINDFGARYDRISLRTAYDGLVMDNKFSGILNSVSNYNRITKKHVSLLNLIFDDYPFYSRYTLPKLFFDFRLKSLFLEKVWSWCVFVVFFIPLVIKKSSCYLTNKEYRSAVPLDRKRILNFLQVNLKNK